jgi:hypothetical protein
VVRATRNVDMASTRFASLVPSWDLCPNNGVLFPSSDSPLQGQLPYSPRLSSATQCGWRRQPSSSHYKIIATSVKVSLYSQESLAAVQDTTVRLHLPREAGSRPGRVTGGSCIGDSVSVNYVETWS